MKIQNLKKISLSKISPQSEFDINYPFYSAVLADSIQKNGIIIPLLAYKERENYFLIDGFQRYRIALKQNRQYLHINIIDKPENPEELIRLRYELLTSQTEELNALQKARILNLINKIITDLKKQNQWRQLLKLPDNSEILKIINWPEQALLYIIKYNVSYNQIKPFLKFSQEDIKSLFNFAAELSIRPVEFIKLSELLNEISSNEKISIGYILNDKPVENILFAEKLNRNQKIIQLKDFFYLRRFPIISQYRREMNELNKGLNSKCFVVNYDKTFERSGLQINAVIKRGEEIEALHNDLSAAENRKILLEMLKKI